MLGPKARPGRAIPPGTAEAHRVWFCPIPCPHSFSFQGDRGLPGPRGPQGALGEPGNQVGPFCTAPLPPDPAFWVLGSHHNPSPAWMRMGAGSGPGHTPERGTECGLGQDGPMSTGAGPGPTGQLLTSFFYSQGSRGDPGDAGPRGDSGQPGPKVHPLEQGEAGDQGYVGAH